ARDGHHVLPVRGAARPRPHHVGRQPGRRRPPAHRRGRRRGGHELRARAGPGHRDHPRDAPGHGRAADRVPQRGPAGDHRRAHHLRAGPGGDGQGLPGAAGRGVQHRGCLLRLQSGAHPPHRRRGALPPRAVTAAALAPLSPTPVVLEGLPLAIDRDEVLRFQGYRRAVDLPDATVVALLEEALALGERLMEPRLVYRATPVEERGADLLVAGGERLAIPQIGRLWGLIEAVGAGICTVGEAIEARVRALFDAREFPLAVMLDSVGSAAAESLAEYANDLLCQAALPEGLRVTNRVSPGYAGWDTAEQARLFRLCPGEPIGVALNEACFM